MTIEIDKLGTWDEVWEALVLALKAARRFVYDNPYDADPGSPYQRAEAVIDHVHDELDRLVLIGIKQIDQSIADGSLVQQIQSLARDAKAEAELLSQASRTVDDIVAVINKATGVIERLGSLPFIGPLAAV